MRRWFLKRHIEVLAILFSAIGVAVASYVFKTGGNTYPEATLIVSAFFIWAWLLVLVLLLYRSIYDIKTVAIRVTYHDVFDDDAGVRLVFDLAKNVVRKAKKEILALNWVEQESAKTTSEKKAREDYFGLLIKKAGHLSYRRIIQSYKLDNQPTGPGIIDTFDDVYISHFRQMLDLKKRHATTDIFVAPPTVPSTFIIVDDEYLVWQLVERESQTGSDRARWRARGIFVIHDSLGDIVPSFRATFDRLERQNDCRHLKPDDLTVT